MKTINVIASVLFLLVAISSCTPKMNFVPSQIVPAATGEVRVKKDKNKNFVVDVNVRNLAEPKRLDPPRDTYVVWMESGRDAAKKLGQIRPASRNLRARLTTTETTQPDNVFITAEDNADVLYPGGQTVLTTRR